MQQGPLPFERGTYMSAPGLEGQEFYDVKNKQWIKIVKNTDAAALARRQLVRWEDASAFGVDLTTLKADGPAVAGVVDPLIPSGETVAVNKNCYIVTGGIVTVAVGTGSSVLVAGLGVMPSADSDTGKVDAALVSTAAPASAALALIAIGDMVATFGVAQASANINSDTEILLWRR